MIVIVTTMRLNGKIGQLAQELRLSYISYFALHVFTDGSARDLPRKRQCGRWSFTASTVYSRHGGKLLVEACGPVHTCVDADEMQGV